MTIITINRHRNVTRYDYISAAAANRLRVTSTFYTYQGEGPLAGRPSLFVRLAGCNIGAKEDCPWCDTKFDLESSQEMTVSDMRMRLQQFPHVRHIVLTGGEPLMQWDTLVKFIEEIGHEYVWQFETNGLLLREEMMGDALDKNLMFVVSPKVTHGQAFYRAIPVWYTSYTPGLINLKYVVESAPLSPYYGVPTQAIHLAHERRMPVYVSGMTAYKRPLRPGEVASLWDDSLIDRETTAGNYAHAARIALEHGLRVSFQTHLLGDVE